MNSTFKCLRKESQHYSVNCVSNHALLHSINDTWCTHNIVNIVWIHKFSGTGWLLTFNYLQLISSRCWIEQMMTRGTPRQVYFFLPHDQKYRQVHISSLLLIVIIFSIYIHAHCTVTYLSDGTKIKRKNIFWAKEIMYQKIERIIDKN